MPVCNTFNPKNSRACVKTLRTLQTENIFPLIYFWLLRKRNDSRLKHSRRFEKRQYNFHLISLSSREFIQVGQQSYEYAFSPYIICDKKENVLSEKS